MPAAIDSTHWAAIATVGLMLSGAVVGAIWRLGSIVKAWRDETARSVGEMAGLVADWCDEVDDHLGDQDGALRQFGYRVQRIETAQGLPAGELTLPRRRQRRPRRMDAAERGLRASGGNRAVNDAIERERQTWRGGFPPG